MHRVDAITAPSCCRFPIDAKTGGSAFQWVPYLLQKSRAKILRTLASRAHESSTCFWRGDIFQKMLHFSLPVTQHAQCQVPRAVRDRKHEILLKKYMLNKSRKVGVGVALGLANGGEFDNAFTGHVHRVGYQ